MDDLGLPSFRKPAYGCLESEGAKRLIEMDRDGGPNFKCAYTAGSLHTNILWFWTFPGLHQV